MEGGGGCQVENAKRALIRKYGCISREMGFMNAAMVCSESPLYHRVIQSNPKPRSVRQCHNPVLCLRLIMPEQGIRFVPPGRMRLSEIHAVGGCDEVEAPYFATPVGTHGDVMGAGKINDMQTGGSG